VGTARGAGVSAERALQRDEPKEMRPMTVRWKPLLVLSGLFLMVALVGVIAITLAMMPRSSAGILKLARAASDAGRFEDAEIYYKQALQIEPKNAAIHAEFAGLYQNWLQHAAVVKRAEKRTERLAHLMSAVKFDKTLKEPRRALLAHSMSEDLGSESLHWAKEVISVEPDNTDAHYVLAAEALENRTPNVPEVRRHLEILDAGNAAPIRRLWIRARLAEALGDAHELELLIDRAGKTALGPDAGAVDRALRLRIASLAVRTQNDQARLESGVANLLEQVKGLGDFRDLAATRVARLRLELEQTQRALILKSAQFRPAGKKAMEGLVDAIDVALDSIFEAALAGVGEHDLATHLTYADHLRFRKQYDKCLKVVDRALQSPQASRPAVNHAVMGLHMVAVEMALARVEDAQRFERAAPHIKALLENPEPRYQGLGHLFAGSVDLDRSGLARANSAVENAGAANRQSRPKLRNSALEHLKRAAAQLPDIAEAQARYGVALVLAGEQNLGRQFLSAAVRLGSLDAQYQLWAAWTILQAGYPEEAEPIVAGLIAQVSQGKVPRELESALHMLKGALYQARREPGDLEKARQEYDKVVAGGHEPNPTVAVRLAQIDVQLGEYDRALKRLDGVRAVGDDAAAAEQLAVLTLERTGKKADARARLRAAHARYPQNADLVGLDAALLVQDGKPADADGVLAAFLQGEPDNTTLVLMRAQILAEKLKQPDQARALLVTCADRTDQSAPLVQLAALELEGGDLDAAAAVIAKIKSRWKEAAAGDVLEAQLALKRGNTALAVELFDAALKKDPDNKIVQFWKAQLDGQAGSVATATETLEALVREKPVKEVDSGITLMSAAQSALANLSLRTGDFDTAIRRFEELKRGSASGTLTRSDQWQLITAYVAKGQWPRARREIAAVLNDQQNPPSDEERVRGANLYRQQGEELAALDQLDYVLKVNPANPSAVVTRSYILLKAKQFDQAKGILRTAIELSTKKGEAPPVFYLMLAAVENEAPPAATALARALSIVDQGLSRTGDSIELVQARYAALASSGDAGGALDFVEAKAKAHSTGPIRRFLAQVCREQRKFARAEAVLRALLSEAPEDANLAAALVQVVSLQAAEARAANEQARERELSEKAVSMIREYRKSYPNNLAFLQAECDIVARQGDFGRAIQITHEIDKVAPSSTLGPMLRARLAALMDRPQDAAAAYSESLTRNPRQIDVRVLLGQTELKLGKVDEALQQARLVLDVEKDRADAVLLEARALAEAGGTSRAVDAQRQAAVARLEALTKAKPRFVAAYHALADIHVKRQDRAAAAAALQEDLKANPNDAAAAGQLVHLLAQPLEGGKPPGTSDLSAARRVATEIAARDENGTLNLALSIGFHKAGQLELALPHAEAAAAKLDSAAAHLNLGDLLLTMAESQPDPKAARRTFERAVAEYDRVLKSQPGLVEAVNNKAWILHTYLGESQKALALVLELQKRTTVVALPGEFYDTLGAIQESLGQIRDAEQSYVDGLRKSPEHPVLNFHFGKLIAGDPGRAEKARSHLNKALSAGNRLSPPMAKEAEKLLRLIDSQKTQR
jgi:tetratricopeptide (TPR) repeat protein